MENIDSNFHMSQCSCAILFVKSIYYCWKSRWFFVNILYPVIKKVNDYLLHNDDRFLACKYAIQLIVKTLNTMVTKKIYTTNLSLVGMMSHMLNPLSRSFSLSSKNILTNLNIQTSSLHGLKIWTHLIIWNN